MCKGVWTEVFGTKVKLCIVNLTVFFQTDASNQTCILKTQSPRIDTQWMTAVVGWAVVKQAPHRG